MTLMYPSMSTTDLPAARAAVVEHPARPRYGTPSARPVVRPRTSPGLRLAAAVDRAAADLTAATVVGELTAGLAWTAAMGETCLLTGAVADVRAAVAALRSGDLVGASAALAAARVDLPEL